MTQLFPSPARPGCLPSSLCRCRNWLVSLPLEWDNLCKLLFTCRGHWPQHLTALREERWGALCTLAAWGGSRRSQEGDVHKRPCATFSGHRALVASWIGRAPMLRLLTSAPSDSPSSAQDPAVCTTSQLQPTFLTVFLCGHLICLHCLSAAQQGTRRGRETRPRQVPGPPSPSPGFQVGLTGVCLSHVFPSLPLLGLWDAGSRPRPASGLTLALTSRAVQAQVCSWAAGGTKGCW